MAADVDAEGRPGGRHTAEEAGQARVVGEMERTGRQVLAVPRYGGSSGER
jgi:hypothetical protein